jgi:hypothetical protein
MYSMSAAIRGVRKERLARPETLQGSVYALIELLQGLASVTIFACSRNSANQATPWALFRDKNR